MLESDISIIILLIFQKSLIKYIRNYVRLLVDQKFVNVFKQLNDDE